MSLASPTSMASTFEGGRVVVRSGVVEVDGRPFVVGPQTKVEAIVDPPRMKPWLVLLGLSLLCVPATVVAAALLAGSGDHSWLVAIPMPVAIASIIRVLTATTRYHVALVAERKMRFIFSSEDLQQVVYLVAMVRDSIPSRH